MQTRNLRVNPIHLKCDLELKSAWSSQGLCTPSYFEEHLDRVKVNENRSKGSVDIGRTRNARVIPMTL